MATTTAELHDRHRRALNPFHAAVLAGTFPLFLGALLSDIAYANTYQIQWQNFASWLIVGGLVFCAVTLVCAIVGLFRGRREGRGWLYALLVLATFVVGFFDALVHAMDAWAMMPGGLVLSAIATVLAFVAIVVGFAGYRDGGVR